MQSLDDDMDELFRRAGEQYPLNTTGADWNKVMQELHPADDALPAKNNNKYKFLWLLLLLPIGFVCGRYVGNDNRKTEPITNNRTDKSAAPSSSKQAPAIVDAENGGLKGTSGKTEKDEARNKDVADNSAVKAVTDLHNNRSGRSKHNMRTNSFAEAAARTRANKALVNKAATTSAAIENNRNNPPSPTNMAKNAIVKEGEKNVAATTAEHQAELKKDTAAAVDANEPNVENNEASKPIIGKEKDKKPQPFKRKLYYSFVIGPDLSTVKQEKTAKMGYSAGLLLGYQVTRRLSIEAGALWDRKNYYALGEDLDTSKLQLPRRSIVSNVDGYCDMIEIPVNIQYNVISKAGHSWFISAGLSSYLMQKENYSLSYKVYNQPYVKDYGYKNSSTDWFSIANVSAGYQKTIGKHTNISVAPYIKLPLRGVGIGKLPITSTGIYIGLSRSIQ